MGRQEKLGNSHPFCFMRVLLVRGWTMKIRPQGSVPISDRALWKCYFHLTESEEGPSCGHLHIWGSIVEKHDVSHPQQKWPSRELLVGPNRHWQWTSIFLLNLPRVWGPWVWEETQSASGSWCPASCLAEEPPQPCRGLTPSCWASSAVCLLVRDLGCC